MSALRNRVAIAAVVLAAAACASTQKPGALSQAEAIYNSLGARGADRVVEGDVIRMREAINTAQIAVSRRQNADYVNGVSHIALREAQTAQAAFERAMARAAADSLRQARLARLLTLSESQRAALAREQKLSEAEIAALRERNMMVSQQADSLSRTAASLSRQADSLRAATEEANRRLNEALGQLRTLVVEITNLRETSRGIVISLSDILFDVNQATLKPGAAQNIARIATVLRQYPDKQIAVEGHTDSDGSDAYNQSLSERRAAAVREALVAGGVAPGTITSRGFGESQPVTTNATAAGKQQNRRVEVVVLGAGSLAGAASDTTTRSDTTVTTQPPR